MGSFKRIRNIVGMDLSIEAVKKVLSNVMEPEMKKDIVSLEMVRNIDIQGNDLNFTLHVLNPAMHSRKRMEDACRFAIERNFGNDLNVDIKVQVVSKEDRSADQRKILPGVKNIIAVASGKGGVGKSTVSANLAAGLAKKGFSVGLVDADIYGPSMPIMFDVENEKPRVKDIDGKNFILPVENYGVKILSIGFFADTSQAIVWRGPMASKALNQMFSDAYWGPLDYVIVDLPPGTGDIHLSLVQAVPLTGAVVVSTPQDIALADAKKAVSMFKMDVINVPVLGIIENMAYFTPDDMPEKKYYIFGEGGARNLAVDLEVPFLGELPLIQSIREAGDAGRPAIMQEDTPSQHALSQIISNFVGQMHHKVGQNNFG